MARPKPTVLLEFKSKNFRTEQILQADAIYAVYYKDRPFNFKSISNTEGDIKYKKTVFVNSGHAFGLASKLNKQFKTTDFSVRKFSDQGTTVVKNSNDEGTITA